MQDHVLGKKTEGHIYELLDWPCREVLLVDDV